MERKPTKECFKYYIDQSNRIATNNLNKYPIQEQAALKEIWSYEESNSTLGIEGIQDKAGSSKVYTLKSDLKFEDVKIAFLKMFVFRYRHRQLLDSLSNEEGVNPNTLPIRIREAYRWLKYLEENWITLYNVALSWKRTLMHQDFIPPEIAKEKLWDFDIDDSVYKSKMWSILFPDICIPYDTRSRIAIKSFLGQKSMTYADMLRGIRAISIELLNSEKLSITEFRKIDDPSKYIIFDPALITLPKENCDYGSGYTPKERPISRILDKFFYDPGTNAAPDNQKVLKNHRFSNEGSKVSFNIRPLSNMGSDIKGHELDSENQYLVKWGNNEFKINTSIFDKILEAYFTTNDWYPLGSSQTNPIPGGLGKFVRDNFPNFSPRHASAIAAILVNFGDLEFMGKRPIYLRRIPLIE